MLFNLNEYNQPVYIVLIVLTWGYIKKNNLQGILQKSRLRQNEWEHNQNRDLDPPKEKDDSPGLGAPPGGKGVGAEQGVLYLASPWSFGEMRTPGETGAKDWP